MTASEIAELGLPALPGTERNVRRRASLENWPCRERSGRGGGREYPVSALPLAARTEYARRHVQVDAAPVGGLEPVAYVEPASADAATQRDARLAILGAVERYAQSASLTRAAADAAFCAGYNSGAIAVADWVRHAVKGLTPRTLYRWRAALKAGEPHRLAIDKGAARRGTGTLETANNGAVKAYILALISNNPLLSADQIRRTVSGWFAGQLVSAAGEVLEIPPLRTFQAALAAWREDHKVALTRVSDPDGYKRKYAATGRKAHAHVGRVNQLWMIDASPIDMLCLDGRYTVYIALDLASRRARAYLTRTPRAEGVGLTMRRCLLDWGVPEAVKTDNGSDFVARSTVALFEALDIDRLLCTAYSPNEKAHVERFIHTFQHAFVSALPGFIGHSVADRKIIEARKSFAQRLGEDEKEALCVELSAAEVQHYADEWIRLVYEQRPHEGLGGRTPFAAAATARSVRRTVDARALDVLLAPLAGRDGQRVMSRSGIKINHHYYTSGTVLAGTPVLVRMDPMDLGRILLFSPCGTRALGEAICAELRGRDPKAHIAEVKRIQAQIVAEQTKPIRDAARRLTRGPRVMDLILRDAARQAGTLVELPVRGIAHETPAIRAALEASAPVAIPSPAPLPDSVIEIHRQMIAEEGVHPIRPARAETAWDRWARVGEIKRQVDAGQPIHPDDLDWLTRYRTGPEYKGSAMVYGDPFEASMPAKTGV